MSSNDKAKPAAAAGSDEDYVNPSESLPRWVLTTQAYGLRSAASLGFTMANYAPPMPPAPTHTVWLDATLGKWPGSKKIQVHIFVPQTDSAAAAAVPAAVEPSESGADDNTTDTSPSLSRTSTLESGLSSAPISRTSTSAALSRTPTNNSNAAGRPPPPPSASSYFPAPAPSATANTTTTATSSGGSSLAVPRPSAGRRVSSALSMRTQRDKYKERRTRRKAAKHRRKHGAGGRPALINFHAGGFTLGSGLDDSRWAAAAMAALDCVVFSVDYRLAPGHPFPTPTEDCVDAIVQICRDADRYGVDLSQGIMVSGFSAGATLALSSWLVLQDPGRWGYDLGVPSSSSSSSSSPSSATATTTIIPEITGMALFYPLLDYTIDRPRKRARCPRPDLTLPPGTTDLCDASYIYPPVAPRQRLDPRLSPGLMEDAMVDRLPPLHLTLCEHDMLLTEGLEFAARLEKRGREVKVRVAQGEQHAWDKQPRVTIKENVAVEYGAATAWLRKSHLLAGGESSGSASVSVSGGSGEDLVEGEVV